MATSLALNWSPPPSSPLFDESTNASTDSVQARNNGSNKQQSLAAPSTNSQPAQRTPSPQARSYAAAAEAPARAASVPPQMHQQQQQSMFQMPPMQPYPGQYSAQMMPGMPAFGALPGQSQQQQMPIANQFAWAQYQQMLASQTRHFHTPGGDSQAQQQQQQAQQASSSSAGSAAPPGEEGRRRRTTSGPQRVPPNFNEAQAAYPGVSFAGNAPPQVRSGTLPPGAMPPNSYSGAASNGAAAASGAGGFHPYRRATSRSDAASSTPSIQFGGGPPVPVLPPLHYQSGMPPRTRSSSTTSAGRESASKVSTPPLSYSSVAAGSLRAHQQPQQPQQGSLRGGPSARSAAMPSSSSDSSAASSRRPDGGSRSDSQRSETTSTTAPPPSHARADSASSVASSNGRATPTPAAAVNGKKPSPLSRADDDDDAKAVYGGSDDGHAGGRATPVQGTSGAAAGAGATPKKAGLQGKLRKALSFSTLAEIQQSEAAAAAPERLQGRPLRRPDVPNVYPQSSGDTNGSSGSTRSTSPPRTPDNGAPTLPGSSGASISSRRSARPPIAGGEGGPKRSLFNRKFNSSTDNISISSTVSSASVMLRKVGNLGKLARRHSLMGLTNMFNKDKDGGREGNYADDFGTLPGRLPTDAGSLAAQQAAAAAAGPSGAAAAKASKKDKGKTKKGVPAAASVSHATVELESNDSMTPAASYIRQHQMKAEAEARAERERLAAQAQAQAEAQAKAAQAKLVGKSKTTDDAMENRQKMVEREKERLKSKRGWRKKLGVGSSVSSAAAAGVPDAPTGLETMPSYLDTQPGATPLEEAGAYYAPHGATPTHVTGPAGASSTGYEDSTYEATYDDEELEPPRLPRSGEDSGDEFETDSLRHWGEGIEVARASAANIKSVRSILKNTTGTASGGGKSLDGAPEKPFAGRLRANSYDAPQGAGGAGALSGVPLMSQMSSTPAGTDRMDGVAPRPESPLPASGGASSEKPSFDGPRLPSGAPMGHHANSSMPTLSLMMNPSVGGVPQRSVTAPQKKRILFAEQHIYHSTWPAHVYDRRGELATCNRLTPQLAQRIKEELNTYKMEEMAVAPTSRINTHFFV